uniref:Uncharacterized protein n=1 Tax=Opuntia streptacantha TaxID=393608 RepID=A0A7C9EVS0_OPUST
MRSMKAMNGCLGEWKVIQMMMTLSLRARIQQWLLLLKLLGQMGLAMALEVEDQETLLLNLWKKTDKRLQLMPLFLDLPGLNFNWLMMMRRKRNVKKKKRKRKRKMNSDNIFK